MQYARGPSEGWLPNYGLLTLTENAQIVRFTSEQRLTDLLENSRRTKHLTSVLYLLLQVLDATNFGSTNSRL